MSTPAAPPPDKAASGKPSKAAKGPALPDEQFWQHYSPHHEFSLSSVGSFALHALIIGFLILLAIGVIKFGGKEKPMPVEAVELGGGGGSKFGSGSGSGVGTDATPMEQTGDPIDPTTTNTTDPVKPPELDAGKVAETKVAFEDELVRFVKSGDESKVAFSKLDQEVKKKLLDGLSAGRGRGGAGQDGGKDGGKGKGEGDGVGPGVRKTSLTQREKRMLRWSMTFDTRNGQDYLNQLAGLGAILAIPTGPGNPPPGYYVLRDLKKKRGELKEEDVGQIKCIFWVDDRPESVRSLTDALGLNIKADHFVAFMPPNVEEKLFNIERNYKHLKEDEIYETKFKVKPTPQGYVPYVAEQRKK